MTVREQEEQERQERDREGTDRVRDPREEPPIGKRARIGQQRMERVSPREAGESQGERRDEQEPADRVLSASGGDHDAQDRYPGVDQDVEHAQEAPAVR